MVLGFSQNTLKIVSIRGINITLAFQKMGVKNIFGGICGAQVVWG